MERAEGGAEQVVGVDADEVAAVVAARAAADAEAWSEDQRTMIPQTEESGKNKTILWTQLFGCHRIIDCVRKASERPYLETIELHISSTNAQCSFRCEQTLIPETMDFCMKLQVFISQHCYFLA